MGRYPRASDTSKPEAPKQEPALKRDSIYVSNEQYTAGAKEPAKPEGSEAQRPATSYRYDNFYEEFRDQEVRVVLYNEKVLSGRVVESRRYWIKLATDPNTFYYINKAWIVYVQPLKVKK